MRQIPSKTLKSLNRQSGIAAIWLGFTLVPIMGFTFLAVEGSRYIQESSRLKDAAEAAALAVTITDNEANSKYMADKYIRAYVRDIKSDSLSVTRVHQDADDSNNIEEFTQYTVDASTQHNSWFHSALVPSFDKTQTLVGSAVAKKTASYDGDNNIDIVFVTDFSGSMLWSWSDTWSDPDREESCKYWSCKITSLKGAVTEIASEVLCNDVSNDGSKCEDSSASKADKLENRIGIVPFNPLTRERCTQELANYCNVNQYYEVSQLEYDFNRQCAHYSFDYWSWSWFCDRWSQVSVINYPRTVSNMFIDKFPQTTKKQVVSNYINSYNQPYFFNVPLTNKLSKAEQIDSMKPRDGTAVYEGIIRGFQVLNDGKPVTSDEDELDAYDNKAKMLLIVTDGIDNPNNGVFENLVNQGLCSTAREAMPGLYIGVIGVDFNLEQENLSLYNAYKKCVSEGELDVPEEHIYTARNSEELVKFIKELIDKGSKTSTTTLY